MRLGSQLLWIGSLCIVFAFKGAEANCGDCATPHSSPGCSEESVEECVCALDSFCCRVTFDESCATLAADDCDCTDKSQDPCGDCATSHNSRGCSIEEVEECVCEIDSFCCRNNYDGTCAEIALQQCCNKAGTFTGGCKSDDDCADVLRCNHETSTCTANFTDHTGYTWTLLQVISEYVDRTDTPSLPQDDDGDEFVLAPVDISIPPIMDANGMEFMLDDDAVEKFLEEVVSNVDPPDINFPPEGPYIPPSETALLSVSDDTELGDVIGTDERQNLNYKADIWPFSMIARTLPPGGGFACTGFKVLNHNTAMSAAHCGFDTKINRWTRRPNLFFAAGASRPGGSGNDPELVPPECYVRIVPGCYVDEEEDNTLRAQACDFMVYRLQGGGANCATNFFGNYNFGYMGGLDLSGDHIAGYIAGYPGSDGSPNGEYGDLWGSYERNGTRRGDRQIYFVDTSGGESGSSYFSSCVTPQIHGVHFGGGPRFNAGAAYRPFMFAFMKAFGGDATALPP